MSDRFYTEDHEWVSVDESGIATIGVTVHATEELGEIVYVEIPDIDRDINRGDEFGSVESVKTVSSLYAPVTGTVIEKNEAVVESPELMNEFPYDSGWLIRVELSDSSEIGELMGEDAYQSFLDTLD